MAGERSPAIFCLGDGWRGTTAITACLCYIEHRFREERRTQFANVADARFDRLIATGESIPWSDIRRYLEERAAGRPALPPTVKKTSR